LAADPDTIAPVAATNTPAATNAAPGATNAAARASTTNAPVAASTAPALELTPEQMFEGGTNTYNNWVDVSAGGFITGGNNKQFEQQHQTSRGAFGGVEDFHFQQDVAKGTTLIVDGRALFDNHDYKLSLDLEKEKVGYVKFSYNQYRTWYNGDGGFYAPTGAYYPLSGDALELDRGQILFEAGLRLENVPQITFRYTHDYREGEKSSTIWGDTHPDLPNNPALVRGISPSFYDINEHSDLFQLDVTHHIKATEFGGGVSYQTGKLDDSLKIDQFPGEPVEQKITNQQGTDYDLFNVHAFSESWLKKNLLLSVGYSYSDLDNDFSGSRIYGSDFDVGYIPNAQNSFGYYGLTGGSHMHESVADLNLMFKPSPNISIVPSVRAQKEDTDAAVNGMETLADNPAVPFSGSSNEGLLDVRERLDLTFNGITNWVFYGRAELTEGNGNLKENGGLVPVNGIGVQPIQAEIENNRFFQKYNLGARWYPARRVTVDVGGYYKLNNYDYDNLVDSTPNNSSIRYPAYLVMQNFETYDGNVRLTLRPWQNVTLISRYEYQWSTIHTTPDPISGLGEAESSQMQSQILAQDVSWAPWSRLYLQVGFNYVLSDTKTPTSDYTQAILNSQNNYWTLNFSSGFVLNEKTDLNLGYFFYQADNYQDNSAFGLPLGAAAEENGITATLVRRISKNLRLTLKYAYYNYEDGTFGGNQNFYAHMIYSSLRYRF
jgi:hypothetical protein